MSRGREDRSFQSVQKVHKKLPQIGCILRVQSGRRENLLTKWNYSLLKRAPKPSPPRGPNRPPAGSDILLFPRPCQAIAGRRTDYLLSPLWWSFHTGQRRLFSFFTALSVFCVRPVRRNGPGRAFFVSIAETARRRLTDVRRCGTITDGKTEYGKGSL